MLTERALGLAGPSQIARAVGRQRSRVHEYRTRCREGDAAALEVRRRGPRGASKLKGHVLAWAQELLTEGLSNYRSPRRSGCPSRRSAGVSRRAAWCASRAPGGSVL